MEQIKVGVLGLGTVGSGTVEILKRNAKEISRRCGKEIIVTHIAVRNLDRERKSDTSNIKLTDDVMDLVNNPEISLVVELMGGTNLALDAVKAAIINKKHIVTANKALIALHGNELLTLAKEHNVNIAFEAAVAGGIPVIKAIREGMVANKVQWLAGIINGTANFILTEMAKNKRNFAEVLTEAQNLGYAEADPTFDVEGIDAAHKLAILASISFGIPLRFKKVFTEGITKITTEDIDYATELGYTIKHLGIAKRLDDGIELRVHPTLIPTERLLANVNGVMNAVLTMSDAVGPNLYYGPGAGSEPTASAVIADIVDTVRTIEIDTKHKVPALAFQSTELHHDIDILAIDEINTSYYIRASVNDEPGVLAQIATILADHNISIESFIQKDRMIYHGIATIVILTNIVLEKNINDAILKIEKLPVVKSKLCKIRVETLSSK